MIPPARLFDAATALLEVTRDFYVDNGYPFPPRHYVSCGLPAWDCEQATVYVERTFSGQVDQEDVAPISCLVVRSAVLVLEIARCVPMIDSEGDQPRIPTVQEETDAAELVLADPMLIVNAAVDGYRNGQLAGCRGLSVIDWEALGPEGGFAGGRQRFRWQLTEG